MRFGPSPGHSAEGSVESTCGGSGRQPAAPTALPPPMAKSMTRDTQDAAADKRVAFLH